MPRKFSVLGFAAAILVAGSASAQSLSLQIKDGRVNLDANGATVRQILDEWARVGGTRVVNGDRVMSQPLTLKLENVPEREALEVILRSVAGYMTAPRSAASASAGASMYDRIFVLPTSTAPPNANTNAANNGNGNRPQMPRFVRPDMNGGDQGDPQEQPVDANGEPAAVFDPSAQFPGASAQFPGGNPFGAALQQQQQQGQPSAPAPNPGNPFAPTPAPQPQTTPFGTPVNPSPFMPVQPTQTPFGTPAQPQATPFGTPVQPGATPFGTPVTVPPGQPQQQQPPTTFTFIPQVPPTTQDPQQTPTPFGSPVPGVVQPTTPGQRPPGK